MPHTSNNGTTQVADFVETAVQNFQRRPDSSYLNGYTHGLVSAFFVAGAISEPELSAYFSRLDALEAKAGT